MSKVEELINEYQWLTSQSDMETIRPSSDDEEVLSAYARIEMRLAVIESLIKELEDA